MAELNTQQRDGWITHYDGAAESAPTSLLNSALSDEQTARAYDVSRARTVHLRVWAADDGNDSWAGGGVADLYILGIPHKGKDLATTKTPQQYASTSSLVAAFEVTSATSSDTALALANSAHPIHSDASDNSDFFECLDVDFAGVFTGGDIPPQLSLYSAAGESLSSGALDGVAPLSFLIDVLSLNRLIIVPANFSGSGFDRIVIGLRKVD